MDNTPPRNRLIAFYTLLAVATLAMLKPAFDAYYDQMFESARADRLATYDDMAELRDTEARWRSALETGDMSIHDAMEQLGEQGRTAMPQIAPEAPAEMNMDPLRGWSHMPEGTGMPDPQPEEGEAADPLLDTELEGAEAPPEGEGDNTAPTDAAEGTTGEAPGQDTGSEVPGEQGQPGAGGSIPPPPVREAIQQRPPTKQRPARPTPAAQPEPEAEGETE